MSENQDISSDIEKIARAVFSHRAAVCGTSDCHVELYVPRDNEDLFMSAQRVSGDRGCDEWNGRIFVIPYSERSLRQLIE